MSINTTSSTVTSEAEEKDAATESMTVTDSEYATQFFGITPKSFCDGIYNGIVQYVWDGFDAFEEKLKEEYPGVMTEEQYKHARDHILQKFHKTVDKVFDKLENYVLENIFNIPKHVLLPEDEIHRRFPDAEQEAQKVQEEIKRLKEQIQGMKASNQMLEQHLSDISDIQEQYNQFAKQISEHEKVYKEAGVSDAREYVTFILNQAHKLKDCIKNIDKMKPADLEVPEISTMAKSASEPAEAPSSNPTQGTTEPSLHMDTSPVVPDSAKPEQNGDQKLADSDTAKTEQSSDQNLVDTDTAKTEQNGDQKLVDSDTAKTEPSSDRKRLLSSSDTNGDKANKKAKSDDHSEEPIPESTGSKS